MLQSLSMMSYSNRIFFVDAGRITRYLIWSDEADKRPFQVSLLLCSHAVLYAAKLSADLGKDLAADLAASFADTFAAGRVAGNLDAML